MMNEPSVEFFCQTIKYLDTRYGSRYADPTILNMIRTRLGEIESLYITLEIPHFEGEPKNDG